MRVAVVGAGAGGVCAAKYMIGAGFDVTVFEAGSHIGGLWVYDNDNGRPQAYRNLSIISSRRFTRFADFDFDDRTPRFPTHRDMARYLDSYAAHFGVKERIRFRTRVAQVKPAFDPATEAPRWLLTTEAGEQEEFDAVLVATGHLNEPNHVAALREFGGDYRHSSTYRYADDLVGKRICVVGVGNSGVDIASDVCSVAARTVLVARSGVVIQPKVLFGVAFSDIAISLRRRWIPARLRNRLIKAVVYTAHGDLTRLGIRAPKGRTHPTLSESIVADIEYNRVAVRPGITAIDGRRVTFADGSSEEFDVLFGATGYVVSLPFVPDDVVPVRGNHVDLYKRIFSPDWPGLCFVGMLNPLSTLNRIFEEQSRLIALHLAGRAALPSSAVMRADIAGKNRRSAQIYTDSPRHEMEEPDFGYVEELQALAGGRFTGNRPPRGTPTLQEAYAGLAR
ncbi:NAD(P)-binding domain-containing protein [Pseudonocardia ailaonensis]|uniref:NAD(P)-binding domain-containing protein n=1 Tax=Pseudonocardia ailaonensis TaxID=367279 RepID=A0ABN2NGN4_9PSEU